MMNKTIVIADDDAPIVDAIKMILEMEGYTVKTTLDGSKIEKLLDPLPDLFLLDMWMSGEDGAEITKKLKNSPKTKDIPIILISANRDVDKAAKDSGANDFLAKPFEMEDLLEKIKKNL